jgi:5-formyltetrahydrofolate cyclo-ligase
MATMGKTEVRSALRAQRRAIAAGRPRQSDESGLERTGLALLQELGLAAGATVALYESLTVEPPTTALIEALRARGVRVLVPITLPDLDLDWADAADLARTPLGLAAISEVDLVLAPGLSVDASATRLGQGGGCYDKSLPRTRPGTPVVVLLHPEEFPGPTLPREPHDRSVDGVLTVDGHHWLRRPPTVGSAE